MPKETSVPSSLAGLLGEARKRLVVGDAWKAGIGIEDVAYRQGIIKAIDWMESRGSVDLKVSKL